jgi:hypothetical protein
MLRQVEQAKELAEFLPERFYPLHQWTLKFYKVCSYFSDISNLRNYLDFVNKVFQLLIFLDNNVFDETDF